MRIAFAIAILFVLNGLDYGNLGDIFRHGKIRYAALALVPVAFDFFRRRIGWAPAAVGALALFSWIVHDFQILGELPVIEIFICLSLAAAIVHLVPQKLFADLLAVSGAFQGAVAFLQSRGIHFLCFPAHKEDFFMAVGTYGNRAVLAPFLAASLAPALWSGQWWLTIPIALGLIAVHSTLGFAATAAILVIYAWHRHGGRAALLLGVAGVSFLSMAWAAFPHYPGFDFDGRLQIWKYGIEAIKVHPFVGSGIAAWAQYYLPIFHDPLLKIFGDSVPFQLHCDALDFIVEYGIAPFLLLLAGLAQFALKASPSWTTAVCAAILVNSLGNFPFAIISIALVFTVSWAYAQKEAGCLA